MLLDKHIYKLSKEDSDTKRTICDGFFYPNNSYADGAGDPDTSSCSACKVRQWKIRLRFVATAAVFEWNIVLVVSVMESFEIRLRLIFSSSYVTLSQPVEKKLERGIDLETIWQKGHVQLQRPVSHNQTEWKLELLTKYFGLYLSLHNEYLVSSFLEILDN